jgi:hypothetical protein
MSVIAILVILGALAVVVGVVILWLTGWGDPPRRGG